MAANDFPSATSKITEYIENNTINVLGVQVGDAAKGGDGIYNEDRLINTGHISSWKLLPFKERNLIIDERKRLCIISKGKSVAKAGGVAIQTRQQLVSTFSSN